MAAKTTVGPMLQPKAEGSWGAFQLTKLLSGEGLVSGVLGRAGVGGLVSGAGLG